MELRDKISRRIALALAGAVPLAAACPASALSGARSAQERGFDFLMGDWRVRHRKLRKRLAGSTDWFEFAGSLSATPILGGTGNFDRNRLADPAGAYEAHSLRLYNPTADRWSIWWLDGRAPSLDPPVVGRFEGAKGRFFAKDSFEGRPIDVRTTYEPLTATTAQWTQAFSTDGGTTWETNWIMDFARVEG